MLHTDPSFPMVTGEDVTVGHHAILHRCQIGDGSLVAMGATILNGARIGAGCLVGACALITEGKEFPDHSLIVGSPAKVVRSLDSSERLNVLDPSTNRPRDRQAWQMAESRASMLPLKLRVRQPCSRTRAQVGIETPSKLASKRRAVWVPLSSRVEAERNVTDFSTSRHSWLTSISKIRGFRMRFSGRWSLRSRSTISTHRALEMANDSLYGLTASIWSNEISHVMKAVRHLKAGTVWVNSHVPVDPNLPFGGVKQSGMGREHGRAAIDLYTEVKSVCIAIPKS
jgi:hypothetical protein